MAFGTHTLIRRNMTRRRGRSFLLVASIAIAFAIYIVLATFEAGFNGAEPASERLIVTNRIGGAQALPINLEPRIAGIDGVAAVTAMSRLRAHVGDGRTFVGVNAVDPQSYAAFFDGRYNFAEAGLAKLDTQRDGALVGEAIARRQGWQPGQRITLTDTGGQGVAPRDWSFTVAGIFAGAEPGADTNFVIARYDYVDAGRDPSQQGTVQTFGVTPVPGARLEDVAVRIDARFANSGHETRTQTENAYMKAFVAQFADVTAIVRLVVGAAFVTILMIVANTMVFAIRERRLEIGVMKVLGFSRRFILGSVLAETVWLFLLGTGFGFGLAWFAVGALADPLGQIVPDLAITPAIILSACGLALAFAALTGGVPALNAMRVPTRAALNGK